jgi:hypothetical protein
MQQEKPFSSLNQNADLLSFSSRVRIVGLRRTPWTPALSPW